MADERERFERIYLVLFAKGLTEDELIAVAQSGLPLTWPESPHPPGPSGPATTTGAATG